MLSDNFTNASFRKSHLKVKRDNSLRKLSNWTVKKDQKGTRKPQPVMIESKVVPKKAAPSEEKKKKKKTRVKQRKVSILRSSPPRRRRGSSSDDATDPATDPASSADLRSPRRAPRVPGLDVSPPPPADTPNSMRRRRRSGRGRQRQLRCRNRGCANTERTFSTERARDRHEQESCSVRIQVCTKTFGEMFLTL